MRNWRKNKLERLILGGKGILAPRRSQTPNFLADRCEMSKSMQKLINFGLELSPRVCDSIDDEVFIPTRVVLTAAKRVKLPLR